MTMQTVQGFQTIPAFPGDPVVNYTNMLIDAASEKAACIITVPKTGTIDKVAFRTGTVTTGDTVDVRLETVSAANGDPTGTLIAANANGSQVIGAGDDDTWFTTSLTTGPSVTRGDVIAVVIVNGGGGGNMNISRLSSQMPSGSFPYTDLFTASWAKSPNCAVVALEYDDASYENVIGAYPYSAIATTTTYNSGSTPDEKGLKFRLPYPVRVIGFWVGVDMIAGPTDMKLYDSDGSTVLETVSLDNNIRSSGGNHAQYFASSYILAKDTFYRLTCVPSTTSNVRLFEVEVDAVAVMDALEGGQNFHWSERTDAGAWTDTTTKRPLAGLIIDQFDDGTGGAGGGLITHPGMSGGMRG